MLKSQTARTIAASLLTLPMIVALPIAAWASKANFTVQNSNRRVNLVRLYVSSSGRTVWDNDVLGSTILRPGESGNIEFGDRSENQCLYDFKAVFSDGYTAERYGIDVCSSSGIRFY